jgi:hypothetical protein
MIELVLISVGLYFVLMCSLIYYSHANTIIKGSALTLFVLTGLLTYWHYTEYLSSPIIGHPDDKFVYIHHIIEDDQITLWLKDLPDLKNKLYSFPYDRETAKKLEKAKQAQSRGKQSEGEFIKRSREKAPGLEIDDWQGINDPTPKRS